MTKQAYTRLLDMALALTGAGRVGLTSPDLMARVGYPDTDGGKRALMRDLDSLRAVGLEIDNVNDPGEDARYVVRPGDVRLRVAFTPAQRTALTAALVAARDTVSTDQSPLPVDLDRVREAVRAGCLLRFRYNGRRREVDPYAYQWVPGDVVLTGHDRGADMVKTFSVRRMLDLEMDAPGTAQVPAGATRPGLDPVTWLVDPAVEAVLHCPGFAEDVVALVGGTVEGDDVRVTVTNRLIFFARLIELGSRARLDGPEELRAQFRTLLEAV
jgi:predicted DNA-binding transcriptional regulator YafY